MRKITLEPVDNGLIKTITDDNYNGAGRQLEKKEIYILNDTVENSEKLILDIISDLGLFLGNDFDKNVLSLSKEFGNKYQLTGDDLLTERKKLTVKLNNLKQTNQKALI